MTALAGVLDCTTGQAYTVVLGLALAVVLAVAGIPPTLRDAAEIISAPPPAIGEVPGPESRAMPDEPSPGGEVAVADAGSIAIESGPPPVTMEAPMSNGDPPDVQRVRRFVAVGPPGVPFAVASDANGFLYVGTNNRPGRGAPGPSKLLRFSPTGQLTSDFPIDGQAADRSDGLTGVAAVAGRVFVADASTARIVEITPDTGAQRTHAVIPDVGPCLLALPGAACESGLEGHSPAIRGIAADESGRLYVADQGQGIVWLVAARNVVSLWHQSEHYSPGEGPVAVALGETGELFVLVKGVRDAPGSSVVYRLESGSDRAESSEAVKSLDAAKGPTALSFSRGRIFVTNQMADDVVALTPGDESAVVIVAQAEDGLDSPAGLVTRGSSLLVANGSDSDDSAAWAVLEIVAGASR